MSEIDRQAIQDMLDNLDLQLAAGKLDLQTYQWLTAKWQARLQEMAGQAAATGAGTVEPAVERVACPECSAPLEDGATAPGSVVRCGFCRATFTLKQAQEQTARAGQELRRWLDEMVVESVGSGSVDAASRRFIFSEKLYPALQLEYRRGMEPYEDVQQHPLVYLDLLEPLDGYRARDHILVRIPDAVPRVRALSLMVNSPLVSSFAVAEEDRHKLRDLDLGTTNLVYLANVANLLAQPSSETYSSAKENLMALRRGYDDYLSLPHEPGYQQYVQAMRARLEANARILDVLATIFAPDGDFAPQVYLGELEAARSLLHEAQGLVDASSYNPLAVMPLKTGLEREERILTLIEVLLHAYHIMSRSRPLAFAQFYADLKGLLAVVCPRPAHTGDLVAAAYEITSIVRAQRGEEILRRVDDWGWCNTQIEGGRKRPMFGAAETISQANHYWHPFWYATIQYATAKGTFFVSGVEQCAYGLLDAMDSQASPALVLENSMFYAPLAGALSQPRAGDDKPIVPPLVPRLTAEHVIAQAAQRMPDMRNVKVTVEGLVHLPAVLVEYQSKAGARPALYSLALKASPTAGRLLPVVNQFFGRYV